MDINRILKINSYLKKCNIKYCFECDKNYHENNFITVEEHDNIIKIYGKKFKSYIFREYCKNCLFYELTRIE